MKALTLRRRASGVLLHPTALPGPGGIGDLGTAAHAFVDFLAEAGQTWWQMLPVGPAGGGNSPYSSPSTFAGNPLLVCLETLASEGLLDPSDLTPPAGGDPRRVDYGSVLGFKTERLHRAALRFARDAGSTERKPYEAFRAAERDWLEDYALFRAIGHAHGGWWLGWPEELRARQPPALARARTDLAAEIEAACFVQYQFARQWKALREHARARGVGLIGDVPIFVPLDSADVWAHPELFDLRPDLKPRVVAGVPPDYFSVTGQRWGNPHYLWERHRRTGYRWWLRRLGTALSRFDAVRLDHFIGFQRYWEIPGAAPDAVRGRWRKGPGADLFRRVFKVLGDVELIAEDLGAITPAVEALRDAFELPGMRVLQFGFGDDDPMNPFKPHAFVRRAMVYTGTHDNDTTAGWFHGGDEAMRARVLRYLGTSGAEVHWDLVRLAWMSIADTAIVPAQDLLGLGSEARLNRPGVAEGNWEWRLAEPMPAEVAARLRELTSTYGRAALAPPPPPGD